MSLYLRKAHVPPSCSFCGRPAAPWQSRDRNWAGSRWWLRGMHFGCVLKETYIDLTFEENYVSSFYALLRSDVEFDGGHYELPIRYGKIN